MAVVIWLVIIIEAIVIGLILYRIKILPKNPKEDLIDLINRFSSDLSDQKKALSRLGKELDQIKAKFNPAPVSWGLVRFSAFEGVGVNQSFSLCWLDAAGTGYIITNIYAQDSSRLYIKEVRHKKPVSALSPEEKEALNKAVVKLKLN